LVEKLSGLIILLGQAEIPLPTIILLVLLDKTPIKPLTVEQLAPSAQKTECPTRN
jgi:hypothetical protein